MIDEEILLPCLNAIGGHLHRMGQMDRTIIQFNRLTVNIKCLLCLEREAYAGLGPHQQFSQLTKYGVSQIDRPPCFCLNCFILEKGLKKELYAVLRERPYISLQAG